MPNINYDEKFVNETLSVMKDALSEKFGSDVMRVVVYDSVRQKSSATAPEEKRKNGVYKKEEETATKVEAEEEKIVKRPDLLVDSLDRIFGGGSKVVQDVIIRAIQNHFQITEPKELSSIEAAIRSAWKAWRVFRE